MSMDADIPLLLSLVFIVGGLYTLARSADMFIGAASVIARHFGVSPLIVGMVVIGFGTSAPELAVSAISGVSGRSVSTAMVTGRRSAWRSAWRSASLR